MNILQKVGTGIATGAVIATLLATSTFAATSVTVKDNGAHSVNIVGVKNKNKSTQTQTNNSFIFTGVHSSANTGGNKANKNTGHGGTSITTGDATSEVGVEVGGSSNTSSGHPCGCPDPDNHVVIKDNGAHSLNIVGIKNSSNHSVSQTNNSAVVTLVGSSADSGNNTANKNTGAGGTTIDTGDATSTVGVSVTGASNSL